MKWIEGWQAQSDAETWQTLEDDVVEFWRKLVGELIAERQKRGPEYSTVNLMIRLDGGYVRAYLGLSQEPGRAVADLHSTLIESAYYKLAGRCEPSDDETEFETGYGKLLTQVRSLLLCAAKRPAAGDALRNLMQEGAFTFFTDDCGDPETRTPFQISDLIDER